MKKFSNNNFKSGKKIKRTKELKAEHNEATIFIRCGRVMADNIAYAKFRKNLLIW